MDVQIKLWLQGGHEWEFCCDEDDPIVFGLVSALPGANSGANLPPDGLIQIETRTGERLFLTPASLVSVDIVRVTDEVEAFGKRRITAPSAVSSNQLTPAPFTLIHNALPEEVHRVLIGHALAQEAQQPQNGISKLHLSPLEQAVEEAFRAHVEKARVNLNIAETGAIGVQFELFAIGDSKSMSWKKETNEIGSLIYQFHKQPKIFTGGGIRIFDSQTHNDAHQVNTFRDLDVRDNSALIIPEHVVSAGLPVHCPTRAFADGLFVLRGSIWQRSAA